MEKNSIKTITNGKINHTFLKQVILSFLIGTATAHVQHVGIVEKVENDKVYTIEGNSNDEVRNKSYSLNNKSIYGYGSVN